MAGLFTCLKRISNYFVLFMLLVLIQAGGWVGSVHASTCKDWYKVSDVCDTYSNCTKYGASLGDVNAPNGWDGINYTSATSRDIYTVYVAYSQVTRNGIVCENCTKRTEDFQCPSCTDTSRRVTFFSASPAEISAGEPTTLSWSASGCILNATITVGSKTFNFTDVSSGVATWTGTDADDQITEPKKYQATLTVSGDCCSSDSKTIEITVLPPPKSCQLKRKFKSTVDMATGALLQSEQLFATQGGNSAASITLTYNSLDPRTGPLGVKWSHSYEIALVQNDDGSVALREGKVWSYYKLINGAYVAETGDYSTLANTNGTFTLSYKDGSTKTFNSIGQITAMTDAYGNSLAFAYSNGNLSSVTEPTGRIVTFVYDPTSNKLTSIADPAGNNYTFGYDGNLVTTITRPDGSRWQYSYYDAKGLMQSKTDPMGEVTTYTYDANHRIETGTDSAGTKSVENPTGATTVKNATFTEDDGGEWDYVFDSHTGNVTSKTDPYGNTTSYYYNADRTVRAKTEPFDVNTWLTTFYTYDSHGNLLTQTDPVDISTYTPAIDPATVDIAGLATLNPSIKTAISYTYDYANNDQLASITDHRGSMATTTTYQYSVEDGYRVNRVTDPDAHVTTTRYHMNGSIKDVTGANQTVTTYSYYPDTPENRSAAVVGLLYEVVGPDGVKTRYTSYDKNGNPKEIRTIGTDSREIRTVQTFDGMNRLRTVTRFAQGLPDNVTTYNYDKYGNRNYQKDPEGKETNFLYDSKGHVTKVTDAQQHVTEYIYGGVGGAGCPSCSGGGGGEKLTAVIDGKSQTTSFEYDELGRLILETDPMQKKIRYTYYDSGKVREKIDATEAPGKVLIHYYYDTQGRLTRKHYADNTEETYTYNPKGRLETATNANIAYTFTYYDNGWLKSVTDSSGMVINYEQYDGIGQKKLVTLYSGTADKRKITYVYDPDDLNRVKTITSAAGTFTYGYDTFGRRNGLSYPNGTKAGYLYDDLNRLTSLTHSSSGDSAFLSYGYTHDQAGNRKTRTGTSPETYDYDDVYRLKQAVMATGANNYTYDAVGNRLAGPGPKDTGYQYDAANRMLTGKLFGYAYDNNGNQISRTIPNSPDKGWTLTWDYENRLTKMELSKGTTEKRTITFKYDPLGRRIEKKLVTRANGTTKTTTYTYVYEGDNVVLEILVDVFGVEGGFLLPGSTAPIKTFYTHGVGVDEHLAMERNGMFYYYHADGLGSVTAITDQGKKVVQSYTYDPFGMVKPSTSFTNSYTYTGREWDKENGLYFYRARYYDPMEGRFVTKDPIGFKGGINVYAYTSNNPVNRLDPSGLAYFAKRHLGPLPWLGTNEDDDKMNSELVHEQLFFEDGKSPSDVGYFKGPEGEFHVGQLKPDDPKELTSYITKEGNYNDCVMRKAYLRVKLKPYFVLGFNCQAWADAVRHEYWQLHKSPDTKKECCIQ